MVIAQPSLFDPVPDEVKRFAAIAFEKFRPNMEKLQLSHRSSCYWWWKSRWHDWIGYTGQDSHEAWKRKSALDRAWNDVWLLFETEITGQSADGLPKDIDE